MVFVWKVREYVVKENQRYRLFAEQFGYQFDQAQGRDSYRYSARYYSSVHRPDVVAFDWLANPYAKRYANYTTYPFGIGMSRKVAYVISGTYNGLSFQAFTYFFRLANVRRSGPTGVFSIVMIASENQAFRDLPNNEFYERGMLIDYLPGNLDVNSIHERIEALHQQSKAQ
ncbi:hypothetical protein K6V33_05305 [Streptococcus suis]|nr:hypothetical protein [Streptococcus suis]